LPPACHPASSVVEGRPPVTLKAGDVLFIPAGAVHSARNVGTGRAAELATYIFEKGKPLLTVVGRARGGAPDTLSLAGTRAGQRRSYEVARDVTPWEWCRRR
jgi:hypothetical protein